MSTTTARLVDTARQEDVVLTATVNGLAPLYATPCAIGTGTQHERPGPRTVVAIHAEARDAVRHLRIDAWWQPSALAGNGTRRHEVMSVAICE